MGIIKLSEVALHGDKEAKQIKPLNSAKYKKLVKEADDRIEADKRYSVKVYKRAALYVAR